MLLGERVAGQLERLWRGSSSSRKRTLSSVHQQIEEGGLREINAFGSNWLQPSEYEAVLTAYSCSYRVNIPLNHLPINQYNSIPPETLERMLATSLLCKYRATSVCLARELIDRKDPDFFMNSYGHCMLAFFADKQWVDIHKNSSAEHLHHFLLSELGSGGQIDFMDGVVKAVLMSWMHHDDIAEAVNFVNLLLISEKSLIANLQNFLESLITLLEFLRRHGEFDLTHRLLSVVQHSLQRKILTGLAAKSSRTSVDQDLNDLITFSTYLIDREDMKYLSGMLDFYLKKVFPARHSASYRLADIEYIMSSLMRPIKLFGHPFSETKREKASRSLIGYQFYNRILHRNKSWSLYSPKLFAQAALAIGHIDPNRLIPHNTTKLQKGRRFTTLNNIDRRLSLLNQLKLNFLAYTVHHNDRKKTNFKDLSAFYSSYFLSLKLILESSSMELTHIEHQKMKCLDDILRLIRESGRPIGRGDDFSKSVVALFFAPYLSAGVETKRHLTVSNEHFQNFIKFVNQNQDCFNLDTIFKQAIVHFCDICESDFDPKAYSTSEGFYDECITASNNVCHFLMSLSDNGLIESFQYQCTVVDGEQCPVQQFRRFGDCSELEWRSIYLLQISCEQLFNLRSPDVLPNLITILSSLSTKQLVPYSYWSQVIQLCDESKRWEDLKQLLQILLYQGKMIQYTNVNSVLSAYISTDSPHIGYRLVNAMYMKGLYVPAETFRSVCVALGRLSGRERDGIENAEMAEKSFQLLCNSYGTIAFTGNFDTSRGADLLKHRMEWAINSQNESMIKLHLKDCERNISCAKVLKVSCQQFLALLPSKHYEAGIYLITTMLSRKLCIPDDGDIDRFIDTAIEDGRLTLAASMLRTVKHLKETF